MFFFLFVCLSCLFCSNEKYMHDNQQNFISKRIKMMVPFPILMCLLIWQHVRNSKEWA
jgi:hypothetical protein